MKKRTMAALAAALMLAGCNPPAPDARAGNPEKYDRDRAQCNAQVDEYMQSRRNVDNSRRDVFRGDRDRFGQGALPDQMDAYSDTKSGDRVMSSCMEAHGWPQPQKQWWQRIGS
jgi:hypothetical protein